jgi:hypothetical protein
VTEAEPVSLFIPAREATHPAPQPNVPVPHPDSSAMPQTVVGAGRARLPRWLAAVGALVALVGVVLAVNSGGSGATDLQLDPAPVTLPSGATADPPHTLTPAPRVPASRSDSPSSLPSGAVLPEPSATDPGSPSTPASRPPPTAAGTPSSRAPPRRPSPSTSRSPGRGA